MRFLLRLLVVASICVTPAGALAQTWHRAQSAHFVIYSDGDRGKLADFATEAEMFDTLFRAYFGLSSPEHVVPLTIFLLKDSDDVSDLAGDEDGSLAGFYRADEEGSFAVANRARARRNTSLSGQTILFHEYAHHLMAHNFTYAYPAWYREGFAEYFATATFESDGDWTLGEPANHRAIGLRNVRLPLERVLFGGPDELNRAGVDAYYGRAWLLVHMLASDSQRNAQLIAFLNRVGAGMEQREAFEATIGAVDEVENQLERYLRGRITTKRSIEPLDFTNTVSVETLGEAESALAPLSMRRLVGRERAAVRDELRELAARYPNSAPVLAELAIAERDLAHESDEPDFSATEAAVDAALAVAPDHARMNVLKAELMLRREKADPAAARALIERAIAAAPRDPIPLIARYDSYIDFGEHPPVEVVNGLFRAFMMAPEAHNLRVKTAFAMANEGLTDQAIQLVEFLAADPHAGEFGRRVLDQLRRYRLQ